MTLTPERTATGLEALVAWLDDESLESPIKKYEVIDGTVVVSPPPTVQHEDVLLSVAAQLRAACPPHLMVVTRYGWRYDAEQPGSYLEPDLAVLPRDAIDRSASLNDEPPLLALETWSPSTWRIDEGLKKDLYAEGGVPSYWLLDPRDQPRLRVLELRDRAYVETAVVQAPGELAVTAPFPVTLRLP